MTTRRCPPFVRALALGAMFLAVWTPGLVAQVHRPTAPPSTAARSHDYQLLLTQARGIYAQLAAERGLTAQSLTAKLAPVRKSLASWSARYHAKLHTRRIPATKLGGTRPVASTRYVTVAIPEGGVATCPLEFGPSGFPCTMTNAEAINNSIICVYDCPDTAP